MINYMQKFCLSDRTIVVTGGCGSLGQEMVKALCQFKARVIIADVDRPKGQALAAQLKDQGLKVEYYHFDMTDIKNLKTNIQKLIKSKGNFNGWINTAYPRTRDWGTKLEQIRYDSWQKNIDMHLTSYALSSTYAAQCMKKRGGSIINLSSIYGVVGPDFDIYANTTMTMPAAYAAIKAGIINTSRYLASYFGKYNVRVNALCPGGIFDRQNPRFVRKYAARNCLKRMAKADEIASSVVFLSSEASSYITGAVIMVDGGWTAI